MSRRRPRGLTAEENALWDKVRQRATPIHPERMLPSAADIVRPQDVPAPAPITPFQIGEKRTATAIDAVPPRHGKAEAPAMDKKAYTRLKRGKLKPDARIDLHGMTLARAQPALIGFLTDAYVRQLRLVLVITGKGRDRDDGGPIPTPRGVLRHQVPQWLRSAPLRHMVLQVTEAHIRHGGEGALYVYLRRKR